MIVSYIGFGLMTLAAIIATANNRRLVKALEKARKGYSALYMRLMDHIFDCSASTCNPVEVKDESFLINPCYTVYRKGATGEHVIKRYTYDRFDPDDREYKRIHAEEVAEMLNEEP